MQPTLTKLFDEIESQRQKLFDSLSALSVEQLNMPPRHGKWSMAEILSHLLAAEKLSVQYLQKKILGIEQAEDSGWREEIKMSLFIASQRLPGLKFKAPKKVVESTPIIRDLHTLKNEWDRVRNELKALLETVPHDRVNRKIYKHVRIGYINLKQTLIFFREHTIHHIPQIFSQIRNS
jgi:uncharacterized damage-inducible protein DinB